MLTLLKHLFQSWHRLSPSVNVREVIPPLLTDWVTPHHPA